MQSTAGLPMTTARRPKSADGSHTRPLRSSPLARPALNRPLANPTLAVPSSSPVDQFIITTPPVCHVSNPKSCQCPDSCDACSTSPATFRRRSSGPITAGLRSSGRTQSLYLPSTSDSGRARTVAAPPEWEIDSLQSLITSRAPKSSHLRPRTSSGIISSFRPPIPIVEEEVDWQVEIDSAQPSALSSTATSRNSSTSEITHPRSASQDNSWYTVNTYEVTPRFSRLGLAASTVVMPLSPKEHRRLSKNASLPRTDATSSSNTSPTPKSFFIPSSSHTSKSPPTRISLQPPQPSPPPPLSRSNSTSNSSETSSIASTSARQTPTPISASTSSPSLTRSRSSADSISTSYESWPPTPLLERDLVLPAQNDGEECKMDHDHAQIYCSDITITVSSHSNATLPIEQSNPDLQPKPTQQSTFQTPTFPKDIKKGQGSLRKTLTASMATITKTTMTPASEVGKVAVGLQVPAAVVSVSPVIVADSQDTLVPVSTPTLKKKRSSAFRSIWKCCIGKW